MNKVKKIKILSLVLTLIFILTACGDNATNGSTGDDDKENQATQSNKKKTANADDKNTSPSNDAKAGLNSQNLDIDFDQAISLYKEHFKMDDINISSIDLDKESGKYEYEIEGWKDKSEYKLNIDASSGEISNDSVSVDDDEEQDKLDLDKLIKPDEAMKIALDNSTANYVEDWELSFDDGKNQYEISLEGSDDINIDAITKEILAED